MMEVRFATEADIVAWYGETLHRRLRAIVGLIDGEMVAIAGLCYFDDVAEAFCELKGPAYTHKKTIMKGAKQLVQMIEDFGGPVVAVADNEEENAPAFLRHLGFRASGSVVNDMELYRWDG